MGFRNIKEILKEIKNSDKSKEGLKTPSGKGENKQDHLVMTAIGGLWGKPEANSEQPIEAIIRTTKSKVGGKGLMEILNIPYANLSDSDISDLMKGQTNFYKFFKDNEGTLKDFKKQMKTMSDAISSLNSNDGWLKKIYDRIKKEGEETQDNLNDINKKAKIDVSGGDDFSTILQAVSEFKLDDKTKESLKELADMTGKGGSISLIFENIETLNSKNVNFDTFKENMKKMEEATKQSVAVGDEVDKDKIAKSDKAMEAFGMFILGIIGIGLLFVVVGLVSSWIDYAGLAMFAGILLGFLLGVTGIFILATRLLKPEGAVMTGLKEYAFLVCASGAILLLGGLVMRWIDPGSLVLFAAVLLTFLTGVMAVYSMAAQSFTKETADAIRAMTMMVIASAIIMILGSWLINLVDMKNLMKFTFTLGFFLFTILSVFGLTHWMWGDFGMAGMKDAVWLIVGSAFILMLGAAIIPNINLFNLIYFTVVLGFFLFVILGIFKLVGLSMEGGSTVVTKKGEKAHRSPSGFRDALFLIVGSAFILFLGAAIMPHVKVANLILFTVTLSAFLIATMLPFRILKPMMKELWTVAKSVVLVVGLCSAILLIGGGLFMKYPKLRAATIIFGITLAGFIWAIMLAFKFTTKDIELTWKNAAIMLTIVTICGLILMAGGLLMVKFPELEWAVPIFAFVLSGFMWAMNKIVHQMTDLKEEQLLMAAGVASLIVSITASMTGVFFLIAKLQRYIGTWENFLQLLAITGTMVATMFLLVLLVKYLAGDMDIAGGEGFLQGFKMNGTGKGGLNPGQVAAALGVMEGIALIVASMAGAFMLIANVSNSIDGFGGFMKLVGVVILMGGVLFGMIYLVKMLAGDIHAPAKGAGVGSFWEGIQFKSGVNTGKLAMALGIMEGIAVILASLAGTFMLIVNVSNSIDGFGGFLKFVGVVAMMGGVLFGMIWLVKMLAGDKPELPLAIGNGMGKLFKGIQMSGVDMDQIGKALLVIGGIVLIITALTGAFYLITLVQASMEKAGGVGAMLGLLFGMGLAVAALLGMAYLVSKTNMRKMTEAVGIIGLIVLVLAGLVFAFKLLADVMIVINNAGGVEQFCELVNTMNWTIVILCGIAAALGGLMKIPGMNMAIWMAVGVMAAMVGMLVLIAGAFYLVALTLEKIKGLGGIDMQPMIDATKAFLEIGTLMTPLTLMSPLILAATGVIIALSIAMSLMGITVKNFAELKIPIYEGTKVVGYRQLQKSDFKNAAENVSLTVNTLTEGIMKAYDDHKEWYDNGLPGWTNLLGPVAWVANFVAKSPLEKVIAQSKLLAPLISQISEAVKDYASMKIPIYGKDSAEVKSYRTLTTADFANAARNVALTVTTLTEGIMQAYDAHPEWYNTEVSSLWGLCALAGPMGALVGAAGALFQATSDTPLEKVIKQSKLLGPLISSISAGVKDFADLKIATDWDDKGQPKSYRSLKETDFKNAATNIMKVMTTLTLGIMQTYEAHPTWYQPDRSRLLGSFGLGNSTMENVIEVNEKLGKLISKIAKGIKDYADLKMPVKWDPKTGNPTEFEKMTPSHFSTAAQNISKVLVTIGNSLMNVYEGHKEWFDEGVFTDSPFQNVIETNVKLSELVSKVSASIKDYAELRMPDYDAGFTEDGRPKKFKPMTEEDFVAAGTNIGMTVVATAAALMGKTIKRNGESFTLEDTAYTNFIQQYLIEGDEDDFNKIFDASLKIAEIIGKMSDAIGKLADMQFPDVTAGKDENGNWKKYKKMTDGDFITAGIVIAKVVTTTASSIIDGWNGMVKNGQMTQPELDAMLAGDKEFEKTKIGKIFEASLKVSEIIGKMSEQLTTYASHKFPSKYDSKGNPTEYISLADADFTKAADSIGAVLTKIFEAFGAAHKSIKPLLDDINSNKGLISGIFSSGNMGDFSMFVQAVHTMTQIVTGLASVLTAMSKSEIPIVTKGTKMDVTVADKTIKTDKPVIDSAMGKIKEIMTSMGTTFKDMWDQHKNNIFSKDILMKIVPALSEMMKVVSTSATAIQQLASLSIPTGFDENGQVTGYKPMRQPDFTEASNNVKTIVTTLAEALKDAMTSSDWLNEMAGWDLSGRAAGTKVSASGKNGSTGSFFSFFKMSFNKRESGGQKAEHLMNALSSMVTMLSLLQGCIYGYATMQFPLGFNDEGEMQYTPDMSPYLPKMRDNIVDVVKSLSDAIQLSMSTVGADQLIQDSQKITDFGTVLTNFTQTLTTIIDSIIGIAGLAEGDSENNQMSLLAAATKLFSVQFSLIMALTAIKGICDLFFKGDAEAYGRGKSGGDVRRYIQEKQKNGEYGTLTSLSTMLNEGIENAEERDFSFFDMMEQYSTNFTSLQNYMTTFSTSFGDILANIAGLTVPIEANEAAIDKLNDIINPSEENKKSFTTKLKNTLTGLGEIISSILEIRNWDRMLENDYDNQYDKNSTWTDKFGDSISSLFGGGTTSNEKVSQQMNSIKLSIGTYADLIADVTTKLTNMILNVQNIPSNTDDFGGFTAIINGFCNAIRSLSSSIEQLGVDEAESLATTVTSYSNILDTLIKITESASNISGAGFDGLVNSIIKLNNSFKFINTKSLGFFKQQNDQIDKLIQKINSINLKNLLSLNLFVDSLNKLAARMGNLDKLTEAIGVKLTNVLNELVSRLEHAEETIVKAEDIQKRRHELIEKAAQEVKALMETPMKVEVAPSAEMAAMSQNATPTEGGTEGSTDTTQQQNGQQQGQTQQGGGQNQQGGGQNQQGGGTTPKNNNNNNRQG